MPKTSSPDAVVVPMAVASPVRTFRTQQWVPIPRPPRYLLLVQRSTEKPVFTLACTTPKTQGLLCRRVRKMTGPRNMGGVRIEIGVRV